MTQLRVIFTRGCIFKVAKGKHFGRDKVAACVAETRLVESSQIRKHFINPPATLIRGQTIRIARAVQAQVISRSESSAARSHFARDVTRVGIARRQSVDKVRVDKSPRENTESTGGGEKGRRRRRKRAIGGHTGKEVRVPRVQAAGEALRP